MSKWSKTQGVVVPLESLLKERRKENCPAPRRSAGLVGRWGITSFTSIRNRGYVVDYGNMNQKDPGLEPGSGASDSSEAVANMLGSPVAEVARPRKFFKSRNSVLPPPLPHVDLHHHVGFGSHQSPFEATQGAVTSDMWNHANAKSSQQYYQQQQPLSAATPQLSPTGPQSANIGGLLHGVTPEAMAYGPYCVQPQAQPAKEKATRRKPQVETMSSTLVGRKPTGKPFGKKDKKERKPKRSRKDAIETGSAGGVSTTAVSADASDSQPKRNSSRIRNRVVNYNEDEEDSNDYDRTRVAASRQQPYRSALEDDLVPAVDPSFFVMRDHQREQLQQQDPHVSTAGSSSYCMQQKECSPRGVPSSDGGTDSLSGSEGRSSAKPSTNSCLPSPSVTEHRPILLRISKGTSMLITDNEEFASSHHHQQQQLSFPGQDTTFAGAEVNSSEAFPSVVPTPVTMANQKTYRHYNELQQDQHQTSSPMTSENNVLPVSTQTVGFASSCAASVSAGTDVPPAKTELKIKISLGGKPLISSTTSAAASGHVATSAAIGGKSGWKSSSKYNFKKRAIERERARHHQSSKRSKPSDVATNADHHHNTIVGGEEKEREESGRRWVSNSNDATPALPPPPPPPVSSTTVSSPSFLNQQRQLSAAAIDTTDLPGGEGTSGASGGGMVSTARHSFPLPGTDSYEVFRTLSSLSGGDDFDSQSSILGSASSDNNTPKHTLLTPGEDCQIIHSRGSSDCGSDLELSQNSSTAAAPPSDVYSESENTQDHSHQQQQHQNINAFCSTPPVAVVGSSSRSHSSLTPTADVVSTSVPSRGDQRQQTEERVEVLKLNIMHASGKTIDSTAHRVTRNKMKHGSSSSTGQQTSSTDQQNLSSVSAEQIELRLGRMDRNRNNNNNNNVVGSTVSEKRSRKQQRNQMQVQYPTTGTVQQSGSTEEVYEQQTETDDTTSSLVSKSVASSSAGARVRVGTVAPSSASPQPPSSGPKSAVTRQYSRKKKNVVPPDYLGVADSTGSALLDGVFPASSSSGGLSAPASSCSIDVVDSAVAPSSAVVQQEGWQSSTISDKYNQQAQSSIQDAVTNAKRSHVSKISLVDKAPTGMGSNHPPLAAVPPAPMRLVLQKKGTIFKSRPLVGSLDGAQDTKKRHVYKHKWDDDGEVNNDQSGVGGSVGVYSVAGGDGSVSEVTACGSGAAIVVSSSSAGVSSNCADSSGSLMGCHLASSDGGRGSIVGSENGSSGTSDGGAAGANGANFLEYDNDFFESEGASAIAGMAPRSKRIRTGPNVLNSAGNAAASTTGGGIVGSGIGGAGGGPGGGCTSYGVGASGQQLHHHHEYDADSGDYGQERLEPGGSSDDLMTVKTRCERSAKPFYTIVRNVKNSHQMQEIGEFQEMDDDVEYILSALQSDNPISTRCLSALQLATKCMKPAFKMHVRAHGVVTRFFKALSDAYQDASLGLCTAAIMYVFSQDKLNMDLDRDSLELMLNLLDTTDHRSDTGSQQQGQGQLQKIRQRVKELCEEIKGTAKAKHIDTDHVTAGSLAMESLLSLTSQRAGEWFKDELRNLGGIEHLIKTVAECYDHVPELASDWNGEVIARLRKIERCLRVLNNVSLFNRQNQRFLLEHRAGLLVQMLVKLYQQLDLNLMRYPTNDTTPKENTGVVLRELLQPILHMLITLTHSFDEEAYGAHLVGKQPEVINITMHLLLRISDHVPLRCVFDLHLLVLTLLLHLARPSQHNRQQVLLYKDQETNRGGIKALVEYFEEQEEMASHAEAKTNAILETPARTVDAEDAETKLMQKAEHHMEHTYMGSHVCMLIYHLVLDDPEREQLARVHLKNYNFKRMVAALSRYYEFLNLTTNADAESTAHKRQTKEVIDYLSRLDGCEAGIVRSASNEPSPMSHLVGE